MLLRRVFGLSATEVYQDLPAWEVELLLMVARREHELDEDSDSGGGASDPAGPSRPPTIPKSRR